MTRRTAIIGMCTAGLLMQGFAVDAIAIDRELAAQFRAIEAEYDRKLRIEYDSVRRHLPKAWLREGTGIDPKLTEISEFELRRFPALLREALSRYPKEVIKDNLKKIVLLESISFYDVEYGATYSADTVFLSSKGREMGYSDRYLVEGFHHEFSSILFKNYKFPEERWKWANPAGFSYSKGGGVGALKDGQTSLEGSAALYREGFLAPYAKSALEEDFNVYSSIAFSQPEKLAGLMRYDPVKKKFQIWMDFYRSIDPYFTEERILNYRSAMASIRSGG